MNNKYTKRMPGLSVLALTLIMVLTGCSGNKLPELPEDGVGNYYEIFVASFYDSDGDGSGDLRGIESKLDYINDGDDQSGDDLMVDGLWLMPIMPSLSYHKYDVLDYYSIDESYGTMEDFESLMKATDDVGVDVILDLVVNHSSSEHPWFKSAAKSLAIEACGKEVCSHEELCQEHNPYVDYYHFNEGAKVNYHSVPGSSSMYYEGVFGYHMPDLNLDNDELREEILNIARFWLDKGVDGFRLDAVTHYYEGNSEKNIEFLKWFNDSLDSEYGDVYVVGEAWSDGGTILNLYKSGIDSFFNFPFSGGTGEIIMSTKMKKGNNLSKAIERWQEQVAEVNDQAIDAPFLSNHDNARSGGTLNRDINLQKLGANVYQLMPGNTFIYYGEELGMLGSGRDENKRQPMIWSVNDSTGLTLPPADTDKTYEMEAGVLEQLDDETSLLQHYRSLLDVKRRYPEIARGKVKAIELEEPGITAYETTWVNGEATRSVIIIHNLNVEATSISMTAFDHSVYDLVAVLPKIEGGQDEFNENYLIPAMSSIVVKAK